MAVQFLPASDQCDVIKRVPLTVSKLGVAWLRPYQSFVGTWLRPNTVQLELSFSLGAPASSRQDAGAPGNKTDHFGAHYAYVNGIGLRPYQSLIGAWLCPCHSFASIGQTIGMRQFVCVVLNVVLYVGIAPSKVSADIISPHVSGRGKVYSEEPPDAPFYGKGIGGRLAEASVLRIEGMQDLQEKRLEEAVRKFAKAVQLDPDHPTGHVLYARALTSKLYDNKGAVDEELLRRAIDEWKLIWRHDADFTEQYEARSQARKLMRLAKTLAREKKKREKALVAEKEKQDTAPD